jgi:hypothetical protein
MPLDTDTRILRQVDKGIGQGELDRMNELRAGILLVFLFLPGFKNLLLRI